MSSVKNLVAERKKELNAAQEYYARQIQKRSFEIANESQEIKDLKQSLEIVNAELLILSLDAL